MSESNSALKAERDHYIKRAQELTSLLERHEDKLEELALNLSAADESGEIWKEVAEEWRAYAFSLENELPPARRVQVMHNRPESKW